MDAAARRPSPAAPPQRDASFLYSRTLYSPISPSRIAVRTSVTSHFARQRRRTDAPSRFSSGSATSAWKKACAFRPPVLRRPVSRVLHRPCAVERSSVASTSRAAVEAAVDRLHRLFRRLFAVKSGGRIAHEIVVRAEADHHPGRVVLEGRDVRLRLVPRGRVRGSRRLPGCRTRRRQIPAHALEIRRPGGGVAGLVVDQPGQAFLRVEHDGPAVRDVATHLLSE